MRQKAPSAANHEERTWEGVAIVSPDTRLGTWLWPLLYTFQPFYLGQDA